MSDAVTLIAGMIVLVVIIISAYFMIDSIKRGGCNNCEGCSCSKEERTRGHCPRNDKAKK